MVFLNNVRMIKSLRPPPDFAGLWVKVTVATVPPEAHLSHASQEFSSLNGHHDPSANASAAG